MLGEISFYPSGLVITVNGGLLKIRNKDQKPYEAVRIDSRTDRWSKIMKVLYDLEEVVKETA